jgi:hypothetical protein
LTAFFCFILGNVIAQETNKKPQEMVKVDTGRVEDLLQSKNFEFKANSVTPATGTPKNLVGSGYSVTFSVEEVISNLPFYGRAYSGMKLGRDQGLKFQGKPENFNIKTEKGYQVNTTVNDGEVYELALSVSKSGYATLTVTSNARGTISYQGEITKVSR